MSTHKQHFETVAAQWESPPNKTRLIQLERLLSRLQLTWLTAPNILEVGVGTGIALPLLRRYAPDAQIVAIDLAPAMLHRARVQAHQARLAAADGLRLPFENRAFRAMLCHAVFPHFPNQPAALTELHRALQPGGVLVILHDISREEVNAIHRRLGPTLMRDRLPPGAEIKLMLHHTGFSVLKVEDKNDYYLAVAQAH